MFAGGSEDDNPGNVIDFVVFATEGNATDFGNLSDGKKDHGSASNNTRGLFMAGTTGSRINVVDYITIASENITPVTSDKKTPRLLHANSAGVAVQA